MLFISNLDAITSTADADLMHIRTDGNVDKKLTVANFVDDRVRHIQAVATGINVNQDVTTITSDTIYNVTPSANVTFSLTGPIPSGFEVTIVNESATKTLTVDNYDLLNSGTKLTAVKCLQAGANIVYIPLYQETIQNNMTFDGAITSAGVIAGTDLTASGFVSVGTDLKTDSIVSKTAVTDLVVDSTGTLQLESTQNLLLYPAHTKNVLKKITQTTVTAADGSFSSTNQYLTDALITMDSYSYLNTWSTGDYWSIKVDKTAIPDLTDESQIVNIITSYTTDTSTNRFIDAVYGKGQVIWGASTFEIQTYVSSAIAIRQIKCLITFLNSNT